jgi:hypothetical protein
MPQLWVVVVIVEQTRPGSTDKKASASFENTPKLADAETGDDQAGSTRIINRGSS